MFFTIIITRSLIQHGMHEKLLYLFIGFSQFIVLFFGAFAVMSYLYFSKDNQLLSSLPVSSRALFLAKFAMAYVSEIIIGALAVIPTVTTYGIVCIVSGIKLNAAFFILEILGIFIFPIAPLLLITLISLPLMYVVAFFRQRAVSNAIATALIIVLIMSIYFGLIGSFADMSQEMENGIIDISRQFSGVLNGAYYATIFNKPYIDAMLGKKIALNLVIYLVGITILMAINIILSSFFYKRGISVIIEGEGKTARRKVNKELVYTSSGLKYSLIKKEIKTLVNTPHDACKFLNGRYTWTDIDYLYRKNGRLHYGRYGPKRISLQHRIYFVYRFRNGRRFQSIGHGWHIQRRPIAFFIKSSASFSKNAGKNKAVVGHLIKCHHNIYRFDSICCFCART